MKLFNWFLRFRKLCWAYSVVFMLGGVTVSDVSAQQQDANPQINTRFVGNISLEEVARGEKGEGTLLYFLPQQDPDQPSLVVRFWRQFEADIAVAEVFDVPDGMNRVPVQIQGNQVNIDPSLTPTIVIRALGGWWVRDGVANYNLDVQVNGPVHAMWGGGYDHQKEVPTGWTVLVKPGEPAVAVKVRDPGREGIPKWDFRYVLRPLPGREDVQVNYAERKCRTPVNIDLGVSPLWPYVAGSGIYEQPNDQFRPPVVVDWEKGKITHFSELVTVRNQNCSYALYSINGIAPGKTNQPDFEAPFAFYDLSGQGKGFPNLILRTERYPAGDPWSTGLDAEAQAGRPVPKDIETVRYSWRNTAGDWLWDYKIEVLGFHPYTFETPIAGGLLSIDAPPYEQFPQWVIERDWPAVTFIDTEGNSYISSEGIYNWSPREVGIGYVFGWEEASKPGAFSEIYDGFRGEYRFRRNMPPSLYLSTIDNRLHLLGAEGGLWNLKEGLVLHLLNLDGGRYINGWVRERVPIESTEQPVEAQPAPAGQVEESLYALAGYLIYSGPAGVELRQATYHSSKFEILPPTDQASWQLFRERLTPYTDQKRDPKDLKRWLSHFPGKTLAIEGGRISDVRVTSKGFRFVLGLQPGFHFQGANLLDGSFLRPGQYVVTFGGKFTIEPLTPPILSASLIDAEFTQLQIGAIPVALRNDGQEDLPEATLELWATPLQGHATLVTTQTVSLLAQASITPTLQWIPPSAGQWVLIPKIRQPDGQLVTFEHAQITVLPASAASGVIVAASNSPEILPLSILGLISFAAMSALIFWRQLKKLPIE